jgi:hypothetical protein
MFAGSGAWLPAEYRDKQASREHEYPKADLYPVPDRRGVSLGNHLRPVDEQPVDEVIIEVRDFSLGEAAPQFAAAIDAQIDCDDPREDFIKEELHSGIRSQASALPRLSAPGFDVGSMQQ